MIMARNENVEDVEVIEAVEVEEVAEGGEPKAKKEKKPARGNLPEGVVTPVGFAKIVTERELHTDRKGGHKVEPQMIYSYIRNAPKEDPFPLQVVTDDLGVERQVVNIEAGIEWWTRKNERVSARAANAAEKAEKKARKAAEAPAAVEAEAADPVTEVE